MAFYVSSFSDEEEVKQQQSGLPIKLMTDIKKKYLVIDNKDYYRIVSFDWDTKELKFHREGGGFQRSFIFNDDKLKDYGKGYIKFSNTFPSNYIWAKFGFECWEDDFVRGYYNPHEFWNGWRIPYLTLEGIKEFNRLDEKHFSDIFFKFKGKKLFYTDNNDPDQDYEIPPILINGFQVYDCGCGLTWDIIED